MSLQSLMNENLTAYRKAGGSDGQGGFNTDYAPIGAFMGRVYPAGQSEKVLGARWDALVSHTCITQADFMKRGDMIEDEAGKTYRLIADVPTSRVRASLNHRKLPLEEIQVNAIGGSL